MDRLKTTLLAACLAVAVAVPAEATPVTTYSNYSVLNNQAVTLSDAQLNIANEVAGSGQITLGGVNTPGGILNTWCIDIADMLQSSGSFKSGSVLDGSLGNKINALITHVAPDLAMNSDSSSALQVAIWEAKYGSNLSVSAPANVAQLVSTYTYNVDHGIWNADPNMRVAVLSGADFNHNQDQAYLTPVPEPASLAALGAGLLGLGLVRRKRA